MTKHHGLIWLIFKNYFLVDIFFVYAMKHGLLLCLVMQKFAFCLVIMVVVGSDGQLVN